MAMLGLLQLLAANNVSESDMYKIALQINSYWFPDTYLTLAKYFATQNISWDKVNPKEVLGAVYSSASGYRQILAKIEPIQNQEGWMWSMKLDPARLAHASAIVTGSLYFAAIYNALDKK